MQDLLTQARWISLELRIGYFKSAFDTGLYGVSSFDQQTPAGTEETGSRTDSSGAGSDELPYYAMSIILEAEAAAAFDELTRSNRDTLLVRQHRYAWPNLFRTARYITAVEYIQANRIRTDLIEDYNQRLKDFDVVVTPSFRRR